MFVPNHKKYKPVFVAGTYIDLLWFGTNVEQSFEPIIMRFLQSVQNSHNFSVIGSLFSIFAQGLQKTHSKWPVSDTQYQK